jgi:type IV secretory pathway VirB2 component (pilin)
MINKLKNSSKYIYGILLSLAAPCVATADPLGEGTQVSSVLHNLVSYLTGDIAKIVAIIAVIGLGYSCYRGQMEMKRAGAIVIGIAIVFSASSIVSMLSGS